MRIKDASGAQRIDLKKRRRLSALVICLSSGGTRLSSLVTRLAAMSPPIRWCLLLLAGALVAQAAHIDPHPELRKILEDIAKDVVS